MPSYYGPRDSSGRQMTHHQKIEGRKHKCKYAQYENQEPDWTLVNAFAPGGMPHMHYPLRGREACTLYAQPATKSVNSPANMPTHKI